MRTVWKVGRVDDDGRVVSSFMSRYKDLRRFTRVYRTARGARLWVRRCMAFSTPADAKAFAGGYLAQMCGWRIFRAECESARSIRKVAYTGGNNIRAFERADGYADGWRGFEAPPGTLYCKNLRIIEEVT